MKTLWLPPANAPFVEALDVIAATQGRWAVVGGFAVWVHLGGAHRVTLDIDTAAGPVAHQTLVTVGTPGTNPSKRNLQGTELEVIEVDDPTGELDGLNPKQRLFVTAHWAAQAKAIETAEVFQRNGRHVQYIRSIFVPGESHCMCLFEAPTAQDVADLNDEAGISYTRVTEALDMTP